MSTLQDNNYLYYSDPIKSNITGSSQQYINYIVSYIRMQHEEFFISECTHGNESVCVDFRIE